MNRETARKVFIEAFPNAVTDNVVPNVLGAIAQSTLDAYHREDLQFPESLNHGDIYLALQILSEANATGHKNAQKRSDRSAGQSLRKKRTGNRRG